MQRLNYIDLLDRAGRAAGERVAVIGDGISLTHEAFARLTSRLAGAMLARGFEPSMPYAVLGPNTPQAMIALVAGMRAGGAWSNINLRSGAAANADVLRRGGCRVLFFHSAARDQIDEIRARTTSLQHVVCLDRALDGFPSLEAFMADAPEPPATLNIRIAPDGVAFQGATGGTTGASKFTQAGTGFMTWNTIGFMAALNRFSLDDPPVNLAVAPISHAGGIVAMYTLAMGGTVVLMATPELGRILANIVEYRVSLLFLPPTLIYMLMNHPDCRGTDFSSLRYLMAAAAPFSPEKIAQAHAVFGPVVCQSLGQTESGFPLTFIAPETITEALRDPTHAKRLKSVGRPTVNVAAIEIVDDAGNVLGPDVVGEIAISATTTMDRYLNDPEATAAIQGAGWQRTGDVGFRDADGFVYLSDRKRDLIVSGGFNVFPLQVEDVLNRHPAVQDCAVIGVPDEKWGEAVKAVVELAPDASATADELIAICRSELGSVMAPKSVDFVDQLPRSAVGKVLKRALREPYWRDRDARI